MYVGDSAIDYLKKNFQIEDSAESSHWKYFNKKVRFSNNIFHGFEGFGRIGKRFFGFSNLIHYIFQKPFRDEGKKLKEFYNIDKIARYIAHQQKRAYDIDCLRHALVISFIIEKLNNNLKDNPVTCIIGDGFSFMTNLLINMKFTNKIYLINLSKVLIADLLYLKACIGNELFNSSVNLVTNKDELILVEENHKHKKKLQIIAIQAKDFELLEFCNFNFAINMNSMQEMNLDIIKKYFYFIKKSKSKEKILFYCCNRVEKKLFDGSIIRFDDYPWNENDKILFDESCPIWNQRTYMIKPPFYINFMGEYKHRLVFLSKLN